MQLYLQAVLGSDDFDKDVFDMEHFVVCQASAHNLNTAYVMVMLPILEAKMFKSSRIFTEALIVLLHHTHAA